MSLTKDEREAMERQINAHTKGGVWPSCKCSKCFLVYQATPRHKALWDAGLQKRPHDGSAARVARVVIQAHELVGLLNGSLMADEATKQTLADVQYFHALADGNLMWCEGEVVSLAVYAPNAEFVEQGDTMPDLPMRFISNVEKL